MCSAPSRWLISQKFLGRRWVWNFENDINCIQFVCWIQKWKGLHIKLPHCRLNTAARGSDQVCTMPLSRLLPPPLPLGMPDTALEWAFPRRSYSWTKVGNIKSWKPRQRHAFFRPRVWNSKRAPPVVVYLNRVPFMGRTIRVANRILATPSNCQTPFE